MSTIQVVMTTAGPVPTSPINLQQALITGVASTNPDYTANLPGTLIEDISSTDVGAMVTMDQARVDAINSLTPYGANAFVLAQLGVQFGLPQGVESNTSVYVVFTSTPGYVIPAGFTVSDGTHQYVVQDGGVVGGGGVTPQLFAVATQSGSWAVPANTVTTVQTSVAGGYAVTVTNPEAGTPGGSAESTQDYRARMLKASIVAGQGTPNYLATLLEAIPGVSPRLVNILQVSGGWEVICGGGDSYLVAGAIYLGTLNLSSIVGSATSGRNVTVTITDAPNNYNIVFVNPPQQVVTVVATWNTDLPNYTAGLQINQLAAPALQNYINGIVVGQPINELQMASVFQQAVASILPQQYLSTLTFAVTINSIASSPTAGTSIIPSDPESYFYASASGIVVAQG